MSDVRGRLEAIRRRYFRTTMNGKKVVHSEMCAVYGGASQPFFFCSCGLLHDLDMYFGPSAIADSIFPAYSGEIYRQLEQEEMPPPKPLNPEHERLLRDIFGDSGRPTVEQIELDYLSDRSDLLSVFGDEYPEAVARLDQNYAERKDRH